MRFRSWTNIALLLAVAVLVTAFFLLRDGDRLQPASLTDLDPAAVTGFSVRYADGRPAMRVEERDEGWHLVEPIDRPARSARIVRILSFLNDRSDACYALSDERLADFGLDEARLVLGANGAEVEFGDRAPDGRRYVRSGERLCLVDDVAYPLLSQGADAVAVLGLLPGNGDPVAIRTPEAAATDPDGDGEWEFERGEGAGKRWAVRWRATSATGLDLDPPADDLGQAIVELEDGTVHRWRIAVRAGEETDLVLVPEGRDYGLRIPRDEALGLIEPPQRVEDGLN